MSIVKTGGRAGVVLPDSVLTDTGATEKVRENSLRISIYIQFFDFLRVFSMLMELRQIFYSLRKENRLKIFGFMIIELALNIL